MRVPVQFILLVALLGPAETIAGKFVQHSEEYLALHPAPPPPPGKPPAEVSDLCGFIEAGGATADAFAALGDALLRATEKGLAYRAFHRAHRLRPDDTRHGRTMVLRKQACVYVPDRVIGAEQRAAKIWVNALQAYERSRIESGKDPDDLDEFHARFGRAEDDLWRHIGARRRSWAGGIVGLLVGAAFLLGARRFPRKLALVPLLVAGVCAFGPAALGQTGLLYHGAAGALAGGVAVLALGRRRP